jgi:NitT/TauT family transport system substrate-binding protein
VNWQVLPRDLVGEAVRRVAAANLEVHDYAGGHPDEAAKWYMENLKPNLAQADLTDDLASFVNHNHPVDQPLVGLIRASIEDLQLIKVICPDTDAKELASRIAVNVLA